MRQFADRLRVALLVPSLILLVGCGDSSSSPSASTAPSQPSAPSGGGYGGGYGGGGGDGYGGGYANSGDETTVDDEGGSQDDETQTGGSDGYASPGYGANVSDPYASNQNGYGNASGYGNTSGDDQSGYGNAYASGGGGGISFTSQIEPILRAHCSNCHGSEGKPKGDIRLDSADEITASGAVSAGRPESSELLVRVSLQRGEEGAMPPKGPGLRPEEIELLRAWISSGASFGDSGGYDGGGYADGGYGQPGESQPQAPPPPKNLAGVASREFSAGRDNRALHYLYAQAMASSDDGAAVLQKYRWVKALERPTLAVRWGIGVKYSEKSQITGGPRPIGVNQDLPGGDRGDSGGGREGFDEEAVYGSFKNDQLDFYTGMLGALLAERLQMRIERGYFGEVLKEELSTALASDRDDFDDQGQGFRGGGFSDDGYGGAPRGGGYDSGYGGRTGGGSGDDDSDDKPEDKIEQVMPGVTMLGTGSLAELYQRAHDEGIDALVVFDVNAEKNMRARLYSTTTKARFYDVATESQLVATRALNNVMLQKALAKDPEDDTINLELDKIFTVADEDYRCVEIPQKLQTQHVVQRVKKLMERKDDNPLPKLSEIRFYRSRDFLTDEQLAGVFRRIVPEKSEGLLKAEDDDAVTALVSQWIPSGDELGEEEVRGRDRDENEGSDEERQRSRSEFR